MLEDGLDGDATPPWMQRFMACEKAELARFRERVQSTTEDERAERLKASSAHCTAGFDSRGRPSLVGILPERGSRHRSQAPKRPSAMKSVIKNFSKVGISDRYRRSRPRARA